jgi:hypothetical protein
MPKPHLDAPDGRKIEMVRVPPDRIDTVDRYLPLVAASLTPSPLRLSLRQRHVIYVLEVRLRSGLKWHLKQRFSDLRQLHKDFKALHTDAKKIAFPNRSFLRHKAQAAIVEDRRVAFEIYFQKLVRVPITLSRCNQRSQLPPPPPLSFAFSCRSLRVSKHWKGTCRSRTIVAGTACSSLQRNGPGICQPCAPPSLMSCGRPFAKVSREQGLSSINRSRARRARANDSTMSQHQGVMVTAPVPSSL